MDTCKSILISDYFKIIITVPAYAIILFFMVFLYVCNLQGMMFICVQSKFRVRIYYYVLSD